MGKKAKTTNITIEKTTKRQQHKKQKIKSILQAATVFTCMLSLQPTETTLAKELEKVVKAGVVYEGNSKGEYMVTGFEQQYDGDKPVFTDVKVLEEIEGVPVVKIGKEAFESEKDIQTVELPNSVRIVEKQAFYQCSGLESVAFPQRWTWVEEQAFYGCSNLKDADVSKVSCIGKEAFANCTSLENVTVCNDVYERTFYGCSGLKTVTISMDGNNLLRLGSEAFADCTKLGEVSVKLVALDGWGESTEKNVSDQETGESDDVDKTDATQLRMCNKVFDNTKILNDAKKNNEPAITSGDVKGLLWIGAGDGNVVIDGEEVEVIWNCVFDDSIQDIRNITVDGVDYVVLEKSLTDKHDNPVDNARVDLLGDETEMELYSDKMIEALKTDKLETVTIKNAKSVYVGKLMTADMTQLVIENAQWVGCTETEEEIKSTINTIKINQVDQVSVEASQYKMIHNLEIQDVNELEGYFEKIGTGKLTNVNLIRRVDGDAEEQPVFHNITEQLEMDNIGTVGEACFKMVSCPKLVISNVDTIEKGAFEKAQIEEQIIREKETSANENESSDEKESEKEKSSQEETSTKASSGDAVAPKYSKNAEALAWIGYLAVAGIVIGLVIKKKG